MFSTFVNIFIFLFLSESLTGMNTVYYFCGCISMRLSMGWQIGEALKWFDMPPHIQLIHAAEYRERILRMN